MVSVGASLVSIHMRNKNFRNRIDFYSNVLSLQGISFKCESEAFQWLGQMAGSLNTVQESSRFTVFHMPTKMALTEAIPVKAWWWRLIGVYTDDISVLIIYSVVGSITVETHRAQRDPSIVRLGQGSQWWWPQTPNQRALSVLHSSWCKGLQGPGSLVYWSLEGPEMLFFPTSLWIFRKTWFTSLTLQIIAYFLIFAMFTTTLNSHLNMKLSLGKDRESLW